MCALFSEHGPRPVGDRQEPDWDLREARPGDLEALADLVTGREGGSSVDHRPRLQGELKRIASGASRALWVAERPVGVVAFARAAYYEPSAPARGDGAPAGWYLGGVVVHPDHRRLGIGADLTRARLAWLAVRSAECFFVVNAMNRASIDLHEPFGFREVSRGPELSGVRFTGGVGVLFRARCGAAGILEKGRELRRAEAGRGSGG